MPSMVANSSWATTAAALTSPGGLGEAAATSRCAMAMSSSRRPAIASAIWLCNSDDISAAGKAALPETDRHRQRPADAEIDHGDESEDFERAEGGGRQLGAAPRDLGDGDDGAERGVFDQLH